MPTNDDYTWTTTIPVLHIPNIVVNIDELSSDKPRVVALLRNVGILHNPRLCSTCKESMQIQLRERGGDRWRCSKTGCKIQVGLRKNTFLHNSKLPFAKVIKMYQYRYHHKRKNLCTSHATVKTWFTTRYAIYERTSAAQEKRQHLHERTNNHNHISESRHSKTHQHFWPTKPKYSTWPGNESEKIYLKSFVFKLFVFFKWLQQTACPRTNLRMLMKSREHSFATP